MPLFSKLRADNHYAKGTSILQMLPQIDDPAKAKDSLRQAIDSLLKATNLQPEFGHAWHNLGIATRHAKGVCGKYRKLRYRQPRDSKFPR